MLTKLSKGFAAVAMTSVLGLGSAWAQAQPAPAAQAQQQQSKWKDQAEYDLYVSITKETDNKKRLDLLNTWKEKYPESAYKTMRLQSFLATYQALNQPQQMIDTAKQILAEDANNFRAIYAILLWTPILGQNNPDMQALGEKLANQVQTGADQMKPAEVTDEQWKAARPELERIASRTLGWVLMQKKSFPDAEKRLTDVVKANPNDAEAYLWLASSVLGQQDDKRYSEALYFFARAVSIDGQTALPPQTKQQIDAYLTKIYTKYHGKDDAGLAQLKQEAKAQPFPPAGFHVPSETELAAHKEAELEKTNPSLAFWTKLKSGLESNPDYFTSGMKDALVPPEGSAPLKGKLVSAEPARNPKTLVLALSDATTPEVTLKLDAPMTGTAEPGTELTFRGVATAFTKEPFMLTFTTEKANVKGWPAPAPAAKKAPVRKGGARKK